MKMIFNEIAYQELVFSKLQEFGKKIKEIYDKENKESLKFTPLSEKANDFRIRIAQGLIEDKDIPEDVKEEFVTYNNERTAFADKILNGQISLPKVTKKDIKSLLLPSIDEVVEKCTTDESGYKKTLTELKENGKKE